MNVSKKYIRSEGSKHNLWGEKLFKIQFAGKWQGEHGGTPRSKLFYRNQRPLITPLVHRKYKYAVA